MRLPTYLSGALFMRSYRVLRQNVVDGLVAYELTPSSWVLLGAIAQARDGVRFSELAELLLIKPPLVTTMTRELINRGLIESRPHHIDGRAKLLLITPKGKRFVKTVEEQLDSKLSDLLAGLSEVDMLAFKKVLDTILQNDMRTEAIKGQ